MKVLLSIASRVGAMLLTLVLMSVLIFFAMNYKSPEEVARAAIGRDASPEQVEAYAQKNNLYDPFVVRYGNWAKDVLQGDFGVSPITNRPVAEQVGPGLKRSLTLAVVGVLVAVPVAITLGSMMARRLGKRSDVSVLVGTVAVAATPEFVTGILLLFLLSAWLGWFPIESGSAFAFGTGADKAMAYVLPAATVAIAIVPHLYRFVRTSVREGLTAQYTEAAQLRGLSKRTVYWDFVMRNSAAPIINATALNIVFAVAGLVAIESVFSFPGIGQQLVAAIGQGDAITVQAIALVMAAIILVVFLISDMLSLALNPRLRLSR